MAFTFPLFVKMTAQDGVTPKLWKVSGGFVRVGRDVQGIGRNMTRRLTLPILGAGAAIIGTAARFEASMNQVRALADPTADEFELLKQKALSLGATTQFTAAQVADAMAELALTGLDAAQTLIAIEPQLQLAAASGQDLATSTDQATGVLKGYRFEVSELVRVNDALVFGQSSTKNRVEDLAEAMTDAGPVARGMNIEFAEAVTLVAKLGDNMFRGARGGVMVRNMLARLVNPASEARAAMGRLGIGRDDVLDAEGNVRSLIDVVGLLEEKGAIPADVFQIFGQKAGPGMVVLLGVGREALRAYQAELEKAVGITAEKAAIRMEGATGATKGFISSIEGLALAIAESGLLEWFTRATRGVTEWTRGLSEAEKGTFKWMTVTAGVVALMPLVVSAVGALITVVGVLGGALQFLWANPIGLVILGLVALAAAGWMLYRNWEEVTLFIGNGWNGLVLTARKLKREVVALVDVIPDWLVGASKLSLGLPGMVLRSGLDLIDRAPLAQSVPQGALGLGAQAGGRAAVEVDFKNLPRGVDVNLRDLIGDIDLDLRQGFAMEQ